MLGLEALTGSLLDFGPEDYMNGKKTLFMNQIKIQQLKKSHSYNIVTFTVRFSPVQQLFSFIVIINWILQKISGILFVQ